MVILFFISIGATIEGMELYWHRESLESNWWALVYIFYLVLPVVTIVFPLVGIMGAREEMIWPLWQEIVVLIVGFWNFGFTVGVMTKVLFKGR